MRWLNSSNYRSNRHQQQVLLELHQHLAFFLTLYDVNFLMDHDLLVLFFFVTWFFLSLYDEIVELIKLLHRLTTTGFTLLYKPPACSNERHVFCFVFSIPLV